MLIERYKAIGVVDLILCVCAKVCACLYIYLNLISYEFVIKTIVASKMKLSEPTETP